MNRKLPRNMKEDIINGLTRYYANAMIVSLET